MEESAKQSLNPETQTHPSEQLCVIEDSRQPECEPQSTKIVLQETEALQQPRIADVRTAPAMLSQNWEVVYSSDKALFQVQFVPASKDEPKEITEVHAEQPYLQTAQISKPQETEQPTHQEPQAAADGVEPQAPQQPIDVEAPVHQDRVQQQYVTKEEHPVENGVAIEETVQPQHNKDVPLPNATAEQEHETSILNTTNQQDNEAEAVVLQSPDAPGEHYTIHILEPNKFVQFEQFNHEQKDEKLEVQPEASLSEKPKEEDSDQPIAPEEREPVANVSLAVEKTMYWQVFFMGTEFEIGEREKYRSIEEVTRVIELEKRRLEELNRFKEQELEVPAVPVVDQHEIERKANSDHSGDIGQGELQPAVEKVVDSERLNKTLLEYYDVEIVNKAYDTDSDEEAKEMRMAKVESELEIVETNRLLSNNLTKVEVKNTAVKRKPVDYVNSTKDQALLVGKNRSPKTEKDAQVTPKHKKSEDLPKVQAVEQMHAAPIEAVQAEQVPNPSEKAAAVQDKVEATPEHQQAIVEHRTAKSVRFQEEVEIVQPLTNKQSEAAPNEEQIVCADQPANMDALKELQQKSATEEVRLAIEQSEPQITPPEVQIEADPVEAAKEQPQQPQPLAIVDEQAIAVNSNPQPPTSVQQEQPALVIKEISIKEPEVSEPAKLTPQAIDHVEATAIDHNQEQPLQVQHEPIAKSETAPRNSVEESQLKSENQEPSSKKQSLEDPPAVIQHPSEQLEKPVLIEQATNSIKAPTQQREETVKSSHYTQPIVPKIEMPAPSEAPSVSQADRTEQQATNRQSQRSKRSRSSRTSEIQKKIQGFKFASNILSVKVEAEEKPPSIALRPPSRSIRSEKKSEFRLPDEPNPQPVPKESMKLEFNLDAREKDLLDNKTERPRVQNETTVKGPVSARSVRGRDRDHHDSRLPSREQTIQPAPHERLSAAVSKAAPSARLQHAQQASAGSKGLEAEVEKPGSRGKELWAKVATQIPTLNHHEPVPKIDQLEAKNVKVEHHGLNQKSIHSEAKKSHTEKTDKIQQGKSVHPKEASMKQVEAHQPPAKQAQAPSAKHTAQANKPKESPQPESHQLPRGQRQPEASPISQPIDSEREAMKMEIKELKRTIQEIQRDFVDQQRKSRSSLIEKISPYNVEPYKVHSPLVDPSVEVSRTESIMEYYERNKPTIQYPDLNDIHTDNELHVQNNQQTATPSKLYWHSERKRKPSEKIGKILHRKMSDKKSQQFSQSPPREKEDFRIRPFLSKIASNQESNEISKSHLHRTQLKKKLSKEDLIQKINVNEHNFRKFVKTHSNVFTHELKHSNQSDLHGGRGEAYEQMIPGYPQLPLHSGFKNLKESTSMKVLANPEQELLNITSLNPPRSPLRNPLPADSSFIADKQPPTSIPNAKVDQLTRTQQLPINNGRPTPSHNQPTARQEIKEHPGNISKIEDEPSQQIIEDLEDKFIDFPTLPRTPNSNMNSEELIQLGRETFELFGVTIDDDTILNIKKYRNCVYFNSMDKHILWHYTGKFYIGGWTMNSKSQEGEKSGEGVEFYPQKYVYEGEFKDGKRHGEGTMRSTYRDIYTGQWSRGLRHGRGVLKEASGNSYEGEWKEGRKDGFGKEVVGEKDIYEGVFSNGLKEGMGKQIFPNGDRYEGNYKANKFCGKGTYYWSDSSHYMGDFQNGLRHGKGTWKESFSGGDAYEGEYKNDKKCGMGKYVWRNGVVYTGNFENDLRHGQGIIVDEKGNMHRAIWSNGVMKNKLYMEEERKLSQHKTKRPSADVRKKPGKDGEDPLAKRRASMYSSSIAKIDESAQQLSRITSCLREHPYRDVQQPKLLVQNL